MLHYRITENVKKTNHGTSSCFIFERVFNQTPVYFTTVSAKRIEAN